MGANNRPLDKRPKSESLEIHLLNSQPNHKLWVHLNVHAKLMLKLTDIYKYSQFYTQNAEPGHEIIKPQFSLRLKIKCNDWLLADTCPQAANHCALF